jgi:hypothetical protein
MIIGIDPGPVSSGYAVVCPDYSIECAGKDDNRLAEKIIYEWIKANRGSTVAIESIQSYGKPVGRETFETCYQIGRMMQIAESAGATVALIPRQEYANAICGAKANDAMLRQALLLRFGSDAKGGPLNALKGNSDLRSAYAVAVYWIDKCRWNGEGK